MPLIPLDLIHPAAEDVRRIAPSAADDAALRASVAAIGVLQPVLLCQNGNNGYTLIAGRRRLEAARAAGLAQIPAHVDNNFPNGHALAAAAAENMVRAAMEPLDQWRAVMALQKRGYTRAAAAVTLGLSDRRARQLDKLGRLHPDVIAAIEAHGMPDAHDLGLIATAPAEKQAEALKRVLREATDDDRRLDWYSVAARCDCERIPRSRAIFDVTAEHVVFEQDLFAEPGSDDEEFTTDVAGFLAAQQRALEAQVAANPKMKLASWKKGAIVLPKGWTDVYGDPDKPKKTETVFVAVDQEGFFVGKILRKLAKPDGTKAASTKATEEETAAEPPKRKTQPTLAQPASADEPADDGRAVTSAGRDMIARAKTAALRARLLLLADSLDPASLLAYLVLALGARNVSVTDPNTTRRIPFGSYAACLVPPEGAANLDRAGARHAAIEALADLLVVPDSRHGEEPVIEWIGQHRNADAALPRFDTPEFLATVIGAELRRVATSSGLKPAKTGAGLRAQLAGALPGWRPPGAEFGAPGPTRGDR